MNVQKAIISLKGKEIRKSYPSKEEIDILPELENGGKDFEKLPPETIGNVILNCLANYPSSEKKDGFYINLIGQNVVAGEAGEEFELKEKLKTFLKKVLAYQTASEKEEGGKTVVKGLYFPWVIAQVLEELGETVEV